MVRRRLSETLCRSFVAWLRRTEVETQAQTWRRRACTLNRQSLLDVIEGSAGRAGTGEGCPLRATGLFAMFPLRHSHPRDGTRSDPNATVPCAVVARQCRTAPMVADLADDLLCVDLSGFG